MPEKVQSADRRKAMVPGHGKEGQRSARLDTVTLIGSIAAFCTTISFLPQVVKIYRTKKTHDLSFPMYIIFSSGIFMWSLYGVMVRSAPIIAANAVTFVLCLYIIAMKLKYK